ncbi:MAG: hypothetical protein K0V04_13085 [Deltaproteobacteria bacterium]|nr:hypothetical protein [Deltaproteobacteria bacterium]
MSERGAQGSEGAWRRVGRHGRRVAVWVWAIALFVMWPAPTALAVPVVGAGTAKASETKKPDAARTRARALRRARHKALDVALKQVPGRVDPAARKAVRKAAEAWTGAYRVLSETHEGEQVRIEVEVEVDLVRLTKRVQVRDSGGGIPMFRLGDVSVAAGCGEAPAVEEVVRSELSGQGAVTLEGGNKAPTLDVTLGCDALGAVRHTYLHAAFVQISATADGATVAQLHAPAFGTAPSQAVAAGVQGALSDLAEALAAHRRGHVRVRVRSPMPSARIRRLETAMRNSVLGVSAVEVGAIERGIVELHVRGSLSPRALGKKLEALSLPGFSLAIVAVERPDVLTVVLE